MAHLSTDAVSEQTIPVDALVPFRLTSASVLLDSIRALAAIIVCIEHWRNLFFTDYGQLTGRKKEFLIPYLVTDAGHQAVIIFFVLSGYLISGTIMRASDRGQWSWGEYATHRLVRLWLVLVPALVLGGVWDKLGIFLHHAPRLYGGLVANHMNLHVLQALDLRSFLGNVFFLQTITVPTFGSNGALWSLSNEFWYYLLFPLGFCAVRGSYGLMAKLAFAVSSVGIGILVGKDIVLLFPIWLLGALLWAVRPARLSVRLRAAVGGAYAVLFFALAKVHIVAGLVSDYVLGLATFVFIWVMLSARDRATSGRLVRLIRISAACSYTLYLVHTPLLVFSASLLVGDSRWLPTPAHIALGGAVLLGTLFFAFLIATMTELRTEQIRRLIEKNWVKPRPEVRRSGVASGS